jgi:hypothetical protein
MPPKPAGKLPGLARKLKPWGLGGALALLPWEDALQFLSPGEPGQGFNMTGWTLNVICNGGTPVGPFGISLHTCGFKTLKTITIGKVAFSGSISHVTFLDAGGVYATDSLGNQTYRAPLATEWEKAGSTAAPAPEANPDTAPRWMPRPRYPKLPWVSPEFIPLTPTDPFPFPRARNRTDPRNPLTEVGPKPDAKTPLRPRHRWKVKPRKDKERKHKAMGLIAVLLAIGFAGTEIVDFVDAFHDALPKDKQAGKKSSPQERADAVYKNFKDLDINEALTNLIKEHWLDKFHGKLGGIESKIRQDLGLSTNPTSWFRRFEPQL